MVTVGMDIGSITTKAAVMIDGRLVGTKVIFTGYSAEKSGNKAFEEILDELKVQRSCDIADRVDRLRPEQH